MNSQVPVISAIPPVLTTSANQSSANSKTVIRPSHDTLNLQFAGLGRSKEKKLLSAAGRNHISKVEQLVSSGADVNYQDKNGRSALMAAALNNHTQTVEYLLKQNANPDLKDNSNRTVLSYLLRSDNQDTDAERATLIQKLITPQNINQAPKGENTPVCLAAKHGLTQIASTLVELGADVQTPGKDNMTPLMYSVWNGDAEMTLQILLAVPEEERKAYGRQENRWGNSALGIIKDIKDRQEVRKVLFSFGITA